MTKTVFRTTDQKSHLAAALAMTHSEGFMEDAIAIAAYRPGGEGDAEELAAVAVFECIRGRRADLHFGMPRPMGLSVDLIQAVVGIAFHPKHLNLDRLFMRVPEANTHALVALIKIGCSFEYRERASLARGQDAIVLSLDRSRIAGSAGPTNREESPVTGA